MNEEQAAVVLQGLGAAIENGWIRALDDDTIAKAWLAKAPEALAVALDVIGWPEGVQLP